MKRVNVGQIGQRHSLGALVEHFRHFGHMFPGTVITDYPQGPAAMNGGSHKPSGVANSKRKAKKLRAQKRARRLGHA